MDRQEAIEIVNGLLCNEKEREAFGVLVPELAESEDERIIDGFHTLLKGIRRDGGLTLNKVPLDKCEEWLEKQKEQKPSTEETELNSIAFLEQMGYTCIPPKKEHQNNSDAPKNALGGALNSPLDKDKNLDDIAQDYVEAVKDYNPEPTWELMQTAVCYGYHYREEEEQKPNIELIQRSWYMEGYTDGKFKREPMWNLVTGKGGPRYEKNEKYGQPLEQKPADMMFTFNDVLALGSAMDLAKDDKKLHGALKSIFERVHDAYHGEPKPAEWSEEDGKIRRSILRFIQYHKAGETFYATTWDKAIGWLESLRPQQKQDGVWITKEQFEQIKSASYLTGRLDRWKPSEEQMIYLKEAVNKFDFCDAENAGLQALYDDLSRL